MKVLYFQAQTTQPEKMLEALRKIDPKCPIPQALGDGGLWQCILDISKKETLVAYNSAEFKIYSTLIRTTEIDDKLYRPDYFVQWMFGDAPTISPSSRKE